MRIGFSITNYRILCLHIESFFMCVFKVAAFIIITLVKFLLFKIQIYCEVRKHHEG